MSRESGVAALPVGGGVVGVEAAQSAELMKNSLD